MKPLTPEQFAAIERRVNADLDVGDHPLHSDLAELLAELDRLRADVEYLHGQEAGWSRSAIAADFERDRLSEKNAKQGLALAQAEHELAQLQARRALVLDWCRSNEAPVRYAEHIRTLLGGEE